MTYGKRSSTPLATPEKLWITNNKIGKKVSTKCPADGTCTCRLLLELAMNMDKQALLSFNYCEIPLAVGPSGTGKTTALHSTFKLQVYSKVTCEKIFSMCCSNDKIIMDDESYFTLN